MASAFGHGFGHGLPNLSAAGAAAAPGFAPSAVIWNPHTVAGWAAGFPDSATGIFNFWVNGGIGSPANLGINEKGGYTLENKCVYGNAQATQAAVPGTNSEIAPGLNTVYDNSPNFPFRPNINDSGSTPANQGSHSGIQGPSIANPQDGNNQWVCWTLYYDISVTSGATVRGALWRTILGQAPVKVLNGLPVANANPTWPNGGTQKVNLASALGFWFNNVDTTFSLAGSFFGAEFFAASPATGFIDASNNLNVGLGKFVTAGGLPVDQGAAGDASGVGGYLAYQAGNKTAFLTNKVAGGANPAIVSAASLRRGLQNAPFGPGATPDRPYPVWTHMGFMPGTLIHSYAAMLNYGSPILQDDGLLVTVRFSNNTSTTANHHPVVTAAGGAAFAAVAVPNTAQIFQPASRMLYTSQYLIRMGARDVTAAGADYGFMPTISWDDLADGDTLDPTVSCWTITLIRNLDWVNGPVDVSQGVVTAAGAFPGTPMRCPAVTPTAGKRLMLNHYCFYQSNDAVMTDMSVPVSSELWWDGINIDGTGPTVGYEFLTGDGVTSTGVRDAQYSGTSMRGNIGLTTVFR